MGDRPVCRAKTSESEDASSSGAEAVQDSVYCISNLISIYRPAYGDRNRTRVVARAAQGMSTRTTWAIGDVKRLMFTKTTDHHDDWPLKGVVPPRPSLPPPPPPPPPPVFPDRVVDDGRASMLTYSREDASARCVVSVLGGGVNVGGGGGGGGGGGWLSTNNPRDGRTPRAPRRADVGRPSDAVASCVESFDYRRRDSAGRRQRALRQDGRPRRRVAPTASVASEGRAGGRVCERTGNVGRGAQAAQR